MELEQYLYGYPEQLPIQQVSTLCLIIYAVLSISLLTAFTFLLDKFVTADLKTYQNGIKANLKHYRITDGADTDQ